MPAASLRRQMHMRRDLRAAGKLELAPVAGQLQPRLTDHLPMRRSVPVADVLLRPPPLLRGLVLLAEVAAVTDDAAALRARLRDPARHDAPVPSSARARLFALFLAGACCGLRGRLGVVVLPLVALLRLTSVEVVPARRDEVQVVLVLVPLERGTGDEVVSGHLELTSSRLGTRSGRGRRRPPGRP